jgi:hypothetical protein
MDEETSLIHLPSYTTLAFLALKSYLKTGNPTLDELNELPDMMKQCLWRRQPLALDDTLRIRVRPYIVKYRATLENELKGLSEISETEEQRVEIGHQLALLYSLGFRETK